VAATDLDRIARVTVAFEQRPPNGNAKFAAQFVNDVYVRSIDGGSGRGIIRCVAP
jgi:hypothetical protein